MLRLITEIIYAVGQALGIINKRTDLKNAADVKAAAAAQDEQDEVAKDTKAVAEGDLEQMRKRASE